jgi:hypothetical protein
MVFIQRMYARLPHSQLVWTNDLKPEGVERWLMIQLTGDKVLETKAVCDVN